MTIYRLYPIGIILFILLATASLMSAFANNVSLFALCSVMLIVMSFLAPPGELIDKSKDT